MFWRECKSCQKGKKSPSLSLTLESHTYFQQPLVKKTLNKIKNILQLHLNLKSVSEHVLFTCTNILDFFFFKDLFLYKLRFLKQANISYLFSLSQTLGIKLLPPSLATLVYMYVRCTSQIFC